MVKDRSAYDFKGIVESVATDRMNIHLTTNIGSID